MDTIVSARDEIATRSGPACKGGRDRTRTDFARLDNLFRKSSNSLKIKASLS
jgi:hypothetical protein